ncbi:MAG: sporulation protein YqfD [Firmicutes bacterium]|nr:sporulation protein YqfD [Dethiobacter sp.]MBS3888409.1 sporulation protein YqfD [Bacillota bacterium]
MRNNWWTFLFGVLTLRIGGEGRIDFINSCHRLLLPLWRVKVRHDHITLSTSIKGFFAMRKLARRNRCSVRVVRRHGLPFFMQRMYRRWSFACGILVFALLIWLLSNIVWFIDIEPSVAISSAEIAQVAKEQGLYIGAWRERIKTEEVTQALRVKFPELVFVAVSLRGSRAEIKLVERETIIPPHRPPGDIVAAKNGLLTRLIAYTGQAVVNANATVTAGQVLISGRMVINGQTMPPVHALGMAEARVWYEAKGQATTHRQQRSFTGRVAVGTWLGAGEARVHLSGVSTSPFPYYDAVTEKRIVAPFVEHVVVTFREQVMQMEAVSREQVLADARAQAEQNLRLIVPPQARIVERKHHEEWSPTATEVTVTITVETLEDIGKFVAHADH